MTINELTNIVTQFRDEREWKQFHNPKDLSMAISIESSELMEHFLWKTHDESIAYINNHKDAVADELADVLAYVLSFADVTDIDIAKALKNKMKKNELKYPIAKAKGKSTKYTKL